MFLRNKVDYYYFYNSKTNTIFQALPFVAAHKVITAYRKLGSSLIKCVSTPQSLNVNECLLVFISRQINTSTWGQTFCLTHAT